MADENESDYVSHTKDAEQRGLVGKMRRLFKSTR
jgi:hypothetical protein